uniref:hypothetical protein n=1 Tax=Salmonella sp. TaxID=599 RepID=UPI001CD98CCB|nr:hypothetical protein [Salmonella sp.]
MGRRISSNEDCFAGLIGAVQKSQAVSSQAETNQDRFIGVNIPCMALASDEALQKLPGLWL